MTNDLITIMRDQLPAFLDAIDIIEGLQGISIASRVAEAEKAATRIQAIIRGRVSRAMRKKEWQKKERGRGGQNLSKTHQDLQAERLLLKRISPVRLQRLMMREK